MKHHFKEELIFKTIYTTKKVWIFCSSEDQITADQKANSIYSFTCSGCSEKYRNITRLDEHGSHIDHLYILTLIVIMNLVLLVEWWNVNNVFPLQRNNYVSNLVMLKCVIICPSCCFWSLSWQNLPSKINESLKALCELVFLR